MKGKKMLAVLMASAMGLSAAGGSAQAATFHETNTAALEEIKKSITEAEPQEKGEGGHFGLNVKLEDTGRAIAAMFVPADISWVDNADIAVDSSQGEDEVDAVITATLNGVKILGVNMEMDLKTMDMALQIPELSDALLTGNYTELMNASTSVTVGGETEENPVTSEQYAELVAALSNLEKNPPAPEVTASLVERYLNIVFDAYEEGESGAETITIGDYSVEAETVEGILTTEKAVEMVRTLLTTARDDGELQGILEQASAGTSSEGTVVTQFQEAVDELLTELDKSEGEAEADAYAEDAEEAGTEEPAFDAVAVKLYLDEQGKANGFKVSGITGEEVTPMALVQIPSGEDWTALNAEILDPSNPVRLTGVGTKAGNTLNGTYQLFVSDKAMVDIQATQNTDSKETGVFDGEYVITPIADSEDDSNPMNSLSGFGLVATVHSEKDGGTLKLDVQSGGSSLVNATLRGENNTEKVTVDLPEGAETYALNDDEAMSAYMGTINPMSIFSSLMEAGMPEDFLNQIMGGGESTEEAAEEPAA